MVLKKEDFTEEQWAEIQAEADRRVTQATQTARRGLLTEDDVQTRIDAALAAEREKLKMDEAQRLEADRKVLEDQQKAVAADRRTLKAEKKLVSAGFSEEQITGLLPMFVNLDDSVFESTVDTFVKTNEAIIKDKVDAEKQALLDNGTPPIFGSGGAITPNEAAQTFIEKGQTAEAIDLMLNQAGEAAPNQ